MLYILSKITMSIACFSGTKLNLYVSMVRLLSKNIHQSHGCSLFSQNLTHYLLCLALLFASGLRISEILLLFSLKISPSWTLKLYSRIWMCFLFCASRNSKDNLEWLYSRLAKSLRGHKTCSAPFCACEIYINSLLLLWSKPGHFECLKSTVRTQCALLSLFQNTSS
jgi:hypothetical protein